MPAPTAADAKLEGFIEDEKVTISMVHWDSLRRSLARTMLTLEQVVYESNEMLSRVVHSQGCPGAESDDVPCEPHCPDREWRLSALVIRRNCQQHVAEIGKVTLPKTPDGFYMPPPREFLDRVVAEVELLRAKLDAATTAPTLPIADFGQLDDPALEEP